MGKKFKNKDLAAKLGLSGTLVSLVLNNKADKHGIRKDTQEKVLLLAKQMGFFETVIERGGASPVDEKPGVIGMIVPTINDPFVIQIVPFLQKAFNSIGIGFSILTKDTDDQRYDRMINAFKKFYSGLILVGNAADDATIRSLRSTEYPFVILEKPSRTTRFNSISTDTVAGSQLVVNHIQKLGYKNIIIIADNKASNSYSSAFQDLNDAIIQNDNFNKPAVIEIEKRHTGDEVDTSHLEKLLRPPYRADVMIIMNASLVYPIMTILRNKKIRVPQDIAIVSMEEGIGFDLLFPPLTCLRKHLSAISIKLANMIWSEVKNSGKGKFKRQVVIAPEFVIRNSCGTI